MRSSSQGSNVVAGWGQQARPYLGLRRLMLGANHEGPVTLGVGTNNLFGTDQVRIGKKVGRPLAGEGKGGTAPTPSDGAAVGRIGAVLKDRMAA